MDKAAIKNFSIWARNKLIADITYKAGLLGVTEEGIKDALPQSTQDAEFYDIGTKEPYAIHGEEIKQRKELVAAIKRKASQLDYKDAYRNVVEEVAYTWFNRLIAIRFMEVNDYMPAHIRVLSSDSKNKLEPDLVTTPFDAELEFTQAETEKIMQMKNDNQVDALFRFLFIKQCNALNVYLPKLFEKTSDYTEILLNVSVTDQDGTVYHLTHDINEDDFNISNIGEDGKPTGQVEIIGWMYQYYNTEPKDEAFALLKKNVKITKERIPAATQLFTPDWIVRYMVENSVGRLWLEGHDDNNLKNEWKYYLDEAEQEADVAEQLRTIREEYKNIKPEEIKVIDPCMGSGHILVYAFDVLMQIYENYGYSQRDAAKSIVENNIHGLDIDDRAFQLAYFAIMMKARSYNRRFLTLEIEPNLCAIQESNGLQYEQDMGDFLLSEEHRETLKYLLDIFVDAKEYGSILNVEKRDYDGFLEAWELTAEASLGNVVMMLWYNECNQVVPVLAKQAKILSMQFEIVITNPPYMGNKGMNEKLSSYLQKFYPHTKYDLFAAFIQRGLGMVKSRHFLSMITQNSWMAGSRYEEARKDILTHSLVNLVHLGTRAFDEIGGEVVQTVSFCIGKNYPVSAKGNYLKLTEVYGEKEKEKAFFDKKNYFVQSVSTFLQMPSYIVGYWVSNKIIMCLQNEKSIEDGIFFRQGMATSDNNRFLRQWTEVNINRIGFGMQDREEAKNSRLKWFPYNKGGSYRKWYGNNELVVNWENDGQEMKDFTATLPQGTDVRLKSKEYYFKEGFTWSALAASVSVRYCPVGFIFDTKGSMGFPYDKQLIKYFTGLINSSLSELFLKVLAPTLDFNLVSMKQIPMRINRVDEVNDIVDECIEISKRDWDSYEVSWEFKRHPLVGKYKRISEAYEARVKETTQNFIELKKKEEALNKIFAEIYDLEDEIECGVNDENVTIRQANARNDMVSLLSYFIGCTLGRYSHVIDGIAYAGGQWNASIYAEYMPDKNNVIPLTDEEYLDDDIISHLFKWLAIVYGIDTVDENIDFIAKCIGGKGNSAKEIIRNYFINDFYKEHCATYYATGASKRPIYWLFDSGKQNGFKALIYMHRYNADTIGNLRVDYLHRMERIYESEINRMQDTIDNSSNAREVTAATKRKEKLQKQLKECQEYDEKIGHLALSRIEIDLDDGVKVNYEKVQTANDGKKYQVLAKI